MPSLDDCKRQIEDLSDENNKPLPLQQADLAIERCALAAKLRIEQPTAISFSNGEIVLAFDERGVLYIVANGGVRGNCQSTDSQFKKLFCLS